MPYHPIAAADRRTADDSRPEGWVARMFRLWVEHHRRMIDLGIRPH